MKDLIYYVAGIVLVTPVMILVGSDDEMLILFGVAYSALLWSLRRTRLIKHIYASTARLQVKLINSLK